MSTERKMLIYAVRTTSGQERTVVDLIASRIGLKKLPIVSILAPDVVKGYIFVEAAGPHYVDDLIAGVRHAQGADERCDFCRSPRPVHCYKTCNRRPEERRFRGGH